ncbi:hypothetical protein GCM10010399_16570 [Dactylosporangium fulvum]
MNLIAVAERCHVDRTYPLDALIIPPARGKEATPRRPIDKWLSSQTWWRRSMRQRRNRQGGTNELR